VPTPSVNVFPTPGTYTIPATTITLTESTTVCAATSTVAPSGPVTYGGITTVVQTATTIVCPVATVSTKNGVITSTIVQTTYVCPAAGTYTIAPLTTTVTEASTVLVYPTPASYAPGTYTQPETTVTVTATNFVYICPYTSSTPALPTSAPVAPVAAAAVVPVAASSVASVVPVSSSPAKSAAVPGLGTSGDQWAITYTPYTSTGGCKSSSEVSADIATIASKGFTTVRLYSADSSDCNGLEAVSSACQASGLTMIIGIYIKNTGIAGAQPQVDQLSKFTRWSIVSLVVIGNEAIFSQFVSASELVSFISSAKATFAGCGYTGPVTTTEPLSTLQQISAQLCPVIDIVGCNIHPFFNSDVTSATAGDFVAGQLAIVESLCPGKSGINLETGWPSAGSCNGAACPGQAQQAQAIAGIRAAVGGKSVMFSYINDEWKEPGPFGCERSWGISGLF
jgi:exo-beta-1,3-glucanase (GH17 family)